MISEAACLQPDIKYLAGNELISPRLFHQLFHPRDHSFLTVFIICILLSTNVTHFKIPDVSKTPH
jgi:hypothetical protein